MSKAMFGTTTVLLVLGMSFAAGPPRRPGFSPSGSRGVVAGRGLPGPRMLRLRPSAGLGLAEMPSALPTNRAIRLRVRIEPEFLPGEEIELVCSTRTYCGECSGESGGSSLRMAISGTIERMEEGRFLIGYDLAVRFTDSSGRSGFSAAGSGLLLNGKPTRIVTIGGRSVNMTATLIGGNTGFIE